MKILQRLDQLADRTQKWSSLWKFILIDLFYVAVFVLLIQFLPTTDVFSKILVLLMFLGLPVIEFFFTPFAKGRKIRWYGVVFGPVIIALLGVFLNVDWYFTLVFVCTFLLHDFLKHLLYLRNERKKAQIKSLCQ